ncbi:hypothetical protein ACQVWH_19080 [Bacillus toyonensis]|uniref:hypothetical protein n=1 Tax=Bacillus toyonensis TaxID=155322 RepID=UPI000279649F|nr:hypothetical protein [Bacillus toyonensis]EJQ89405.1 hypothetical protein IGO_01901 [Bacillus toyonensis]KNH39663.1 hypothetical protein ACS75_15950 [Bacillus thuringiensis]HDR7414363.1 hypothetical protein [Bacillus toyonensis]
MLLGHEYEILSRIPEHFTLHNSNYFIFNQKKLTDEFHSTEIDSLMSLTDQGILSKKSDLIYIDINNWIDLFIKELEKTMTNLGYSFICKYNKDESLIQFQSKESEDISKEFQLNFNPNAEEVYNLNNVIHFCIPMSFEFSLFWLDLINNHNILIMFCEFLNNEFERFQYDKKIRFNFFDGLELGDINHIYHKSISSYFTKKQFNKNIISEELNQKIKMFISKEDYEAYQITINKSNIAVVKLKNEIIFFSFLEDKLYYSQETLQELENLKELLLNKVSEYNQIMLINRTKLIDSKHKSSIIIFNIFSYLAISLNFFIYTLNLNNQYLKFATATISIISLLAIIWWIIIPVIKISRFSWEI